MPVLAIDGLAASGKGTLAKKLAQHFGFACLNTGLLYRATAQKALERGLVLDDGEALARCAQTLDIDNLNEAELAKEVYGKAASQVAIQPKVRAALLDAQRAFAMRDEGAVLDGRDIGSFVCPNAEAKLFVTASVEIRARRRLLQEGHPLLPESMASTIAALEARDHQDRTRATAPMVIADDALLLDTTKLAIEGAFEAALELVKGRF